MAKSTSPSHTLDQGNLYDKVIQENLPILIDTIVQKHLQLDITRIEPLSLRLQRTIERKPDYLAQVTDTLGNNFLLHLEFQTRNDRNMVYRMNEYQALMLRKTHTPVLQYVVYMGR